MRLTPIIILLAVLQLSARDSRGQKLTYNKKDVTISELFREIKRQTGYNVVSSDGRLNPQESLDVNFYNTPLDKVMNNILFGRSVTYEFVDKIVVIKIDNRTLREKGIGLFTTIDVRGRVIDENNKPLVGAVIKIKGTKTTVLTNNNGEFNLKRVDDKAILIISFLGYETIEIKGAESSNSIKLIQSNDKLNEVEIVSTGYQELPKERATGSFTVIDNKTLSRTVSPDILSRLKGVTNGLLFDKSAGNTLGISVRGRATIFSSTQPLIVVDNFPFTGDLNTLNPEIVESVTVLKDAAAASIWGSSSGNGVIVITTKKGKLNQAPTISVKGDVTLGGKPDFYYEPQLASNEFIDLEQLLFDKGVYTSTINNGYGAISPVVDILQKIKTDPTYAAQGKAEIDALRKIDYREQLNKYFYRNSSQQRYFADVSGGGNAQSYYFSVGYDKNLPNAINLSDSRIALKASNSYNLLKDHLQLNTDISFSKSLSENSTVYQYRPLLPYEQVADANGTPLPTLRSGGLSEAYTDVIGSGKLLDWKYRPLDELRNKYSKENNKLTDYRINLGIVYKIVSSLNLSVNYQYYNANTNTEVLNKVDSFYARDLINTYSQINSTTGVVTRPVPLGDIFIPLFKIQESNYARAQINFNRTFHEKHSISAIVGYEIRDDQAKTNSNTLLGYNSETATSILIDPLTQYTNIYNGNKASIGSRPLLSRLTNRYISWYGNASYTFDNKYIVSGSYRKDESNLFGVKANQKGVPLWSAGLAWNIQKEDFFKVDWLSSLQLKATYGYNGTVNNSVSAYLTATTSFTNQFNKLQSLSVVNPPNENLRWERVKNINIGLFFTSKNDRISGSFEFYKKDGLDLIANSPIAPQTGILVFTGNTADTRANGVDLQINSRNIDNKFKWNTTYIFNYVKDKITDYKVKVGSNSNIVSSASLSPIVGYPINSIFAYKWAGLDAVGNPQGYLDGILSADYTKIANSTDVSQLDFFGSRTPTAYGSLRNTFSYRNLELSFNITYKMGYYFRRESLNNGALTGGYQFKIFDYGKQWKSPGDELFTSIPSIAYPNNPSRSGFYENSAVLIEPGDHIRFQDVQLNYTLRKKQLLKLPFAEINMYAYVTNLGLLWKKNKQGLDPEVSMYPNPKTIALGIKTNF